MKVDMKRVAKIIRDNAPEEFENFYNGFCPGLCVLGNEECKSAENIAMLAFLSNPPTTLFQAQLIKMGACIEGRVRVGNKTAREWWNTSTCPSDMRWLLNKMGADDPNRSEFYENNYYFLYSPETCENIRKVFPFEALRKLSEGK